MEDNQQRKRDCLRGLHEILFCLNVAYGVGLALLMHVAGDRTKDSLYYCLRSAVRWNNLLHLKATNPSWGSLPIPGSPIGGELTFLLSVVGPALLLLFLLRLIAATAAYRLILRPIAGITALLAVPGAYMWVLESSVAVNEFPALPNPFWTSPVWLTFAAEALCIGGFFYVFRKRSVSLWLGGLLLCIHYGFWLYILWRHIPTSVGLADLVTARYLSVVFPLSGMVFVLYLRQSAKSVGETSKNRRAGKWTIAAAAITVALLLITWLPGRGHSIERAKDIKSLAIKMSRGACRGACPVYTITIHGSGSVEYSGEEYVRVMGPQTGAISREQLNGLLQDLDQSGFSAMEERAFVFCFDTPRVSVSVSVDGRTKRVSSDAACFGPKSGVQAKFVRITDEVDALVGSERWVKCEGHYCR